MRRILLAALVVLVLDGMLVGPAEAARLRAPTASITAVTPVYVSSTVDAFGVYCLYRAEVTLSWSGSIRLWVGHLVDGRLSAQEEILLSGSATNATVLMPEISVRAGDEGPLGARAVVVKKTTYTVLSSAASTETLTCPAAA